MIEPGKEYYAAFAQLQNDLGPIKKTKKGHNWTYASLDDMWETILPSLDKNGFVIESCRKFMYDQMFLCTRLIHRETRQGVEDVSPLMAYKSSPHEYDDKEAGANVTYQRRYALHTLLNLAPEEDATEKKPNKKYEQGSNRSNDNSVGNVIAQYQVENLEEALNCFKNGQWLRARVLESNGIQSIDQLLQSKYEGALGFIMKNGKE